MPGNASSGLSASVTESGQGQPLRRRLRQVGKQRDQLRSAGGRALRLGEDAAFAVGPPAGTDLYTMHRLLAIARATSMLPLAPL